MKRGLAQAGCPSGCVDLGSGWADNRGTITPCHGHQTQPQPWLIHEWMEEKDPNLPKELCSLGFVLWVSFSLLSYYPVLRETYTPPGFATIRNLSKFPVVSTVSSAHGNLHSPRFHIHKKPIPLSRIIHIYHRSVNIPFIT